MFSAWWWSQSTNTAFGGFSQISGIDPAKTAGAGDDVLACNFPCMWNLRETARVKYDTLLTLLTSLEGVVDTVPAELGDRLCFIEWVVLRFQRYFS